MDPVNLATTLSRRLILVVVAFALACDGDSSTYRSPTDPPPPAESAETSVNYFGTETLVSKSERGACSYNLEVGFSQHTAWAVTIRGSEIDLYWDPAGDNDVIFTGTLNGDTFSAERHELLPAGHPCPELDQSMTGTFSADRRSFDATVVEFFSGSGRDQMRLEWRFDVSAR